MRARLLCSEPCASSGEDNWCGGNFLSAGPDDNNGQDVVAIASVLSYVLASGLMHLSVAVSSLVSRFRALVPRQYSSKLINVISSRPPRAVRPRHELVLVGVYCVYSGEGRHAVRVLFACTQREAPAGIWIHTRGKNGTMVVQGLRTMIVQLSSVSRAGMCTDAHHLNTRQRFTSNTSQHHTLGTRGLAYHRNNPTRIKQTGALYL